MERPRSSSVILTSPDTRPTHSRNLPHGQTAHSGGMEPNTTYMQLQVQETLDELLSERLIPFKLIAYGVMGDGRGQYVVPFCDSRLHSMTFFWWAGNSLKGAVRAATLER